MRRRFRYLRESRVREALGVLGVAISWLVILFIAWAIFFSGWFADSQTERPAKLDCDDLVTDFAYELCVENEEDLRKSGDL